MKNKSLENYNASEIEILEGLEPVRHRPGMYIGGTDNNALHHLASEIIDNSMDEVVAKYATIIDVHLLSNNMIKISDNGRGIPVDNHPKFKNKSALEIIMTTLHSGGKFTNKSYTTSGGLHGVGASVVNALSSYMKVEVIRDGYLYVQQFSKGLPTTSLIKKDKIKRNNGTAITFKPDTEIFGENNIFNPVKIFKMLENKAYLFKGVQINWQCDESLLKADSDFLVSKKICYINGIMDYLNHRNSSTPLFSSSFFYGNVNIKDEIVEWVISWLADEETSFIETFCNTVHTPLGGTHENGFRLAMTKGIRNFAELKGFKKASEIVYDDLMVSTGSILSIFIKEPQFQGQTKEKLVNSFTTKVVETAIKDRFETWLSNFQEVGEAILNRTINNYEERKRKKKEKRFHVKLFQKKSDCPEN